MAQSKAVASLSTTTSSDAITVRAGRLVDIAVNIGAGDEVVLEGEYEVGVGNVPAWHVIETYTTDQAKVLRFASERRLRIRMTTAANTTTIEIAAGNKV